MRIAALVLLGLVSLTKLPIDLLPKVQPPVVSVITQWPNVAPEELETQITRPIEQAVSAAPNIYLVSSSTREGTSSVNVQFNWGTDIGQAAVDVLQLVERARQQFPNDPTLETPIVFKADTSQLPILIYGVTGEPDTVKLRTLLDNQITPMIESADGVAGAIVSGGEDRAIMVDVDVARLRAYHLSLADVTRRIAQENVSQPAGIVRHGHTELTIRSVGYYKTPQQIAQTPIGSYNGEFITLGQVAAVRDSHQDTRLYTRFNGAPAVGLLITEQSQANTVATTQNVEAKLAQVRKAYPNLTFSLAYDQAQYVRDAIDNVRDSALIGGALAIVILLFFLRNFRSTLVVALSIPISIVTTFALLYFFGFTLNTISLSGLALATGLIVDDAVVVLENIFRHIERDGKRADKAAVSGATEINAAVIASTLTIMIVFLPLLLIKGQSGQTFSQFAFVVISSIAVSLLDALTVVPMLASRFIKTPADEEDAQQNAGGGAQNGKRKPGWVQKAFGRLGAWFDRLDRSYQNALRSALGKRGWILGGAVLLTAGSLLLVPQIGTELLPQSDSGDFTVTIKMPVGTALADTDAIVKQAEAILLKNPEVQAVFAASGTTLSPQGTTTALTPYQGAATVRLKENHKGTTDDVIKAVQKQLAVLPGAKITVVPYDLVSQTLTGDSSDVAIDVIGTDIDVLKPLADQMADALRHIPNLQGVDVNVQESSPELQWEVDRERAAQLGVSFADIGATLNAATGGTLASYYQEKGFQYPIYVQVAEAQRQTIPELLRLPVTPGLGSGTSATQSPGSSGGASGGSASATAGAATTDLSTPGLMDGTPREVLLGQVAKPVTATGPNEIARQERHRFIGVHGRAQGRSEGDIEGDVRRAMAKIHFPPGYYWEFGMAQRRRTEEFAGLSLAVGMAIALIYMLLASQFESFLYPLVVLSCVPLSISGVLLALFLTGRAFGLTAFIGLLMLIGIVVKNGILLVDYTKQLRERGLEREEAILTAAPTRLRPILMTAGAAVLGMLPLAMGIGKGSETQAPLATAVIGGLTTSTLLTLFIVPIVYTLFDDMARFFRERKKSGANQKTAERGAE